MRHLGVIYLCIPHEVSPSRSENQGRVVALDPGVRSFLTFFSETSFGWLGKYDVGLIQRLCYYLGLAEKVIEKIYNNQLI